MSRKLNVKSKKQHRVAAQNYVKADRLHWIRRIVKEMKGNPRVQAWAARTKLPI